MSSPILLEVQIVRVSSRPCPLEVLGVGLGPVLLGHRGDRSEEVRLIVVGIEEIVGAAFNQERCMVPLSVKSVGGDERAGEVEWGK